MDSKKSMVHSQKEGGTLLWHWKKVAHILKRKTGCYWHLTLVCPSSHKKPGHYHKEPSLIFSQPENPWHFSSKKLSQHCSRREKTLAIAPYHTCTVIEPFMTDPNFTHLALCFQKILQQHDLICLALQSTIQPSKLHFIFLSNHDKPVAAAKPNLSCHLQFSVQTQSEQTIIAASWTHKRPNSDPAIGFGFSLSKKHPSDNPCFASLFFCHEQPVTDHTKTFALHPTKPVKS